jgi:hypothetical protein
VSDEPNLKGKHFAPCGIAHEPSPTGQTLVPIVDFDYDEIDRNLGFSEPYGAAVNGWTKEKMEHCAEGLNEIACWLATSGTVQAAGLRALMLAFKLVPHMFPERCRSELAKHLGVTKQALNKYSTQIFMLGHGRFWGVGDFHGDASTTEAREKRRRITIDYHKRVGHQSSRRGTPKRKVGLRNMPTDSR